MAAPADGGEKADQGGVESQPGSDAHEVTLTRVPPKVSILRIADSLT
jgi:hypothetical protein